MSGRQEEESDKASMCEWGIWRDSRRLVSSGIQKCVPRRREDLGRSEHGREAVSYTHLTLPTIYSV